MCDEEHVFAMDYLADFAQKAIRVLREQFRFLYSVCIEVSFSQKEGEYLFKIYIF